MTMTDIYIIYVFVKNNASNTIGKIDSRSFNFLYRQRQIVFTVRWPTLMFGPDPQFFMALLVEIILIPYFAFQFLPSNFNTLFLPFNVV